MDEVLPPRQQPPVDVSDAPRHDHQPVHAGWASPLRPMIGGAVTGQSKVAKQAYHELMYHFHLAADAFSVASGGVPQAGDSILAPHMSESLTSATGSTSRTSHGGAWGHLGPGLQRHPSAGYHGAVGLRHALGAVDEFVQNLRYRAVIQARAAVQASEAGLHGKAAAGAYPQVAPRASDEAGKAIDGEALREARIATFQQELVPGGAGSSLRNAKSNFPAIGLVLPHIKTPINVLRYSWKYTPGLNLFQTEFRHAIMGKLGGEEQARAIGQMTLASTFGLMAPTWRPPTRSQERGRQTPSSTGGMEGHRCPTQPHHRGRGMVQRPMCRWDASGPRGLHLRWWPTWWTTTASPRTR